MKFEWLRNWVRGKPVLLLDIWLHILVILFYPTLTGRRNALPKESPKRNIQKEKIEIDRRRCFFYTFLYLLGSTTIPWMRGFPEYIEMVESLSLRCQKYINLSHVCMCPHLVFWASIRVSFLLEVLSKSGKS